MMWEFLDRTGLWFPIGVAICVVALGAVGLLLFGIAWTIVTFDISVLTMSFVAFGLLWLIGYLT